MRFSSAFISRSVVHPTLARSVKSTAKSMSMDLAMARHLLAIRSLLIHRVIEVSFSYFYAKIITEIHR